MDDQKAAFAAASSRLDEIEKLLNSYPDVSDEQLGELKRWFKKEASAFEVASLASKKLVGYANFRADHVDKFSKTEMVLICAVALVLLALIIFFV